METKKFNITGFLTKRTLPGEIHYHVAGDENSVLIRVKTNQNDPYEEIFAPGATVTIQIEHDPKQEVVKHEHKH